MTKPFQALSILLSALLTLLFSSALAQLSDDFSDGDFTSGSAVWTVSNTVTGAGGFTVNASGQVQTDLPSGGSGTRRAYISTPVALDLTSDNFEWSFWVNMNFATPDPPNNTNHTRVFLSSDQSDLNGALNGYFIEIKDQVLLRRMDGTTPVTVPLSGGSPVLPTSPISVNINVIRTMTGDWQIRADGVLQGTATDNTYTSMMHFGAQYRYSANSRRNSFLFDDITIQNYVDTTPPVITNVSGAAPNQLLAEFSEGVELTSSENEANYNVSGIGGGTAAARDATATQQVYVTFPSAFTLGVSYTLEAENIADFFGNPIPGIEMFTFTFNDLVPPQIESLTVVTSNALDVLFNEEVETVTAETVANYAVSSGTPTPSAAIRDASDPRLVHLFFSDNFPENSLETLTVSGVEDLNGNAIAPAVSENFIYDTNDPTICTSGCVIATSANTLTVQFSEAVDLITSQIINNYEVLGGIGHPVTALRNPADPSQVFLTFDTAFTLEHIYELRARDIQDLAGNEMGTRTRDFVWDNNLPEVVELRVMSNNELLLIFNEIVEETSAENSLNYIADNGIGNPASAVRFDPDPKRVTLFFAAGMGDFAVNTLTVSNVQDLNSNALLPPQDILFTTKEPTVARLDVLSPDLLRIQFSEDITTASLGTTANYNVPGVGMPATVGVISPAVAELEFTAGFTEGTDYNLNSTNIQDLLGNTAPLLTEAFRYQPRVISVEIVGVNLLDITFDTELAPGLVTDISRYTVDNSIGNPVSAVLDTDDERIVHLAFADNFTGGIIYSIEMGWFEFITTEIAPVSVHEFELDTSPPLVTELVLISPTELHLHFSEPVDEVTAEALNHYTVSGGIGLPSGVDFDDDNPTLVELEFDSEFALGTPYTLTVENVKDLLGNVMAVQALPFIRPLPPLPGDLIITEIMTDPEPSEALPEVEYLEILNTSAAVIHLFGLIIEDGTGTTSIGSYSIEAGEYKILVPDDAVDSFIAYGLAEEKIIPVDSWRSLNNTGEEIALVSQADSSYIFRVDFDDAWYGDPSKENGGWSLEMIDLTALCGSGTGNWTASVNPDGGTPAALNSTDGVFPDSIPPNTESAEVRYPDSVDIIFSEELDSVMMTNSSSYEISPATGISEIILTGGNSVTLRTSSELEPNTIYTLIVNNIEDCAGNLSTDTLSFGAGTGVGPYQLLITEIMADETPAVGQPEAEYIELLNRSGVSINLARVTLSDTSNTISLPSEVIEAGEYLTLTRTADADSFAVAVGVPSFPGLSNTGEILTLRDTNGTHIFSVNYDNAWYGDSNKENGGRSLEMIDPNNPCGEAGNWRASEDPSGGTPSALNSVAASNPDNEAPLIASLVLENEETLRLTFNENIDSISALSISNYSLTGGLSVSEIEFLNQKEVLIRLSAPVNPTQLYTLTVSGVKDCVANTASDSRDFGKGRKPEAGELLMTEIMADESPRVGLPLAEYIEIHNAGKDLLSLDSVELRDGSGARFLPNASIQAEAYVVLCSSSKRDSFLVHGLPPESVLAVPSFPGLTNGGELLELRAPDGTLLHSLDYSDEWYDDPAKEDGGWSLEMIDPENLCGENGNWTASEDSLGGTPGRENSVLASNPDTVKPEIIALNVIFDKALRLTFSKKTDSLSVLDISRYSLNGGLSITDITYLSDKTVRLSFSPALIVGRIYSLTAEGIADCSGNLSEEQTLEFGKGQEPAHHEVLITEIMADPTPPVGLPEREYLEVFNNTDQVLSLDGLWLIDGGSETQLPNIILTPGEYLVLCSTSSENDLKNYFTTHGKPGRVHGIARFPSLGNAGEALEIRDLKGELIHGVTYSSAWYGDGTKKSGGWSLEMVDTNNPCGEASNWRASEAADGGSPADENSVRDDNPDRSAPEIAALIILSDSLLELSFSEKTDSLSMVSIENYGIEGGSLSISEITFLTDRSIRITLSPNPEVNIQYELRISGVQDCSGNSMGTTFVPFGLGTSPSFNEILITEIMADPEPVVGLPESEYLEVFNPTDKIISLGGLSLSDETGTAALPFRTVLPGAYAVLCPSSSVDNFEEQGLPGSRIFGLPSWRSLANGGEQLSIRAADGTLIFEIDYDDDWYKALEKEGGGWSLEMIDPGNPCSGIDNWMASEAPGGGTPAAENSVLQTNPDSRPPKLLRADAIAADSLLLTFDEKLDSIQSMNFAGFDIDKGISITGKIMPSRNRVLLALTPELTERTTYTVRVSGITDCLGNMITAPDNSADFVLPEEGDTSDIIINEVLSNPPVGGVDFIELYNNSDKFVNLQNWQLANIRDEEIHDPEPISEEVLILKPGEYLAVSKDSRQLLNQYPGGASENFHEAEIPAYSDGEGTVILLSNKDRLIDRFDYRDDFHFDLIRDQNNVSLERIDFDAPTNDPHNWHSAASSEGYGTPGYLNSQHSANGESPSTADCFRIENQVFTPDGDGFEDFMQLYYDCAEQGTLATVSVYDMKGRKVRDLAQNALLSTNGGFLTWDGINYEGRKARTGYYLLLIETYNLNGGTAVVKKKVVLGTRF